VELSWNAEGDWEPFCTQAAFEWQTVRELAAEVLQRDLYTCHRCSFRSRPSRQVFSGYMQLEAIGGDYDVRDPQEYVTVCPFCHANRHLQWALESGNFRLIAAPWISRLEIVTVTRALLSVITQLEHLYYAEAVQLYMHFEKCEASVATLIPVVPTSKDTREENLAHFTRLLASVVDESLYPNRDLYLHPLRLLPKAKAYKQESNYWYQAVYKSYPLSKWEKMLAWKQERISEQ